MKDSFEGDDAMLEELLNGKYFIYQICDGYFENARVGDVVEIIK